MTPIGPKRREAAPWPVDVVDATAHLSDADGRLSDADGRFASGARVVGGADRVRAVQRPAGNEDVDDAGGAERAGRMGVGVELRVGRSAAVRGGGAAGDAVLYRRAPQSEC